MPLISFAGSPHGGKQKLLPEWDSQPKITPTTIIDHSIVGSALGAWLMFRDSSNLESHFIIDLNGEIWQCMDTGREADANFEANRYALSIETADNGNPNTFPWTANQLDSLVWLHNKLVAVHPTISRKKATSCESGGLGYHTLFGAPSCWTPSVGKTCPGKPARVDQWNSVLLPKFLNGTEEDMTADQAKQLQRIHDALFIGHSIDSSEPIDNLFDNTTKVHQALVVPGTTTAEQAFNILFDRVRKIETTVNGLSDDETNILTAIAAIRPGEAMTEAQATAFADQIAAILPNQVVDALGKKLSGE